MAHTARLSRHASLASVEHKLTSQRKRETYLARKCSAVRGQIPLDVQMVVTSITEHADIVLPRLLSYIRPGQPLLSWFIVGLKARVLITNSVPAAGPPDTANCELAKNGPTCAIIAELEFLARQP